MAYHVLLSGPLLTAPAPVLPLLLAQPAREACPEWVTGRVTAQPRLPGGQQGGKKVNILGAVGGIVEVASAAELPELARTFLALTRPGAAGAGASGAMLCASTMACVCVSSMLCTTALFVHSCVA